MQCHPEAESLYGRCTACGRTWTQDMAQRGQTTVRIEYVPDTNTFDLFNIWPDSLTSDDETE